MKRVISILPMLLTILPMTIALSAPLVPPDAARKPHTVTAPFGASRSDDYYWLRDDRREDRAMLDYLVAENAHTDALLVPLKPLEDRLYEELIGRIKQDDSSVPYRERGWWYYTRFETGKDYPVYARRPGDMKAAEQVLLDVNLLAEGKDYYEIGDWTVSQDNRLLAYSEDSVGRRQYTIRFKNLETGELYPDRIEGASSDLVWADDHRTLFYVENDPETLLSVRVKRHVLGTPAADDAVVHEEDDDSFYIGVGRSRDDRYILIRLESTVSSEVRYAPADDPQSFAVLAPRQRDVEYDADHLGGHWVIRTNAPDAEGRPATNFKLVIAPSDTVSREQWRDIVPHDERVFIDGFELFDGFVAIDERSGGLKRIRILRTPSPDGIQSGDFSARRPAQEYIEADEPAYSMQLSINSEPDSVWLRYTYTSLTTPSTTYELNTETGERRTLKQQPVIGYDASRYRTERIWADARDGQRIPVSLVYRQDFEKDGTAALLQYGYGSYGHSIDPVFNANVISLLDRGMVYAIAHVRGGQEMGRAWYEDGKLLNKKNTFTDFIDVTETLVRQGYAAPDRVAANGGSAGGLLMGAIANMAPDRYRVIVAQVPFVDVVTTMLDPSIPLTTNEYDEWGNPEQREFYDYMLSYSPYDNVRPQAYPAIYVGTGLWDSQVQYWEPAKWVAKLRDENTGDRPIVFRINMEAGHGGKSGRFQQYREKAESYAFLLNQLGVE
ncbi:MAG: S9 family peptidase [Xanthomonadaceae bacterium]|jgi:oligopeptidase B|nr:S9 family peptidase [Xanthomonadaceae bacterium]